MIEPFKKVKLSAELMRSIRAQAAKAGLTVDEFATKVLSVALAQSGEEITLEELVKNADHVIDELIRESRLSETTSPREKDAEI